MVGGAGPVTAYFAVIAAVAVVLQAARLVIAWVDFKRRWNGWRPR
jgi:hypothetical protein